MLIISQYLLSGTHNSHQFCQLGLVFLSGAVSPELCQSSCDEPLAFFLMCPTCIFPYERSPNCWQTWWYYLKMATMCLLKRNKVGQQEAHSGLIIASF